MAVILKSQTAAQNTLGNMYGFSGPNDWSLRLDFENSFFQKKSGGLRSDVKWEDYINCARETPATSFDEFGFIKSHDPLSPRLGRITPNGSKGLITEPLRRVMFANPWLPESRSVPQPITVSNEVLTLTVYGTGSVSVTGGIAAEERGPAGHTITATEGNPAYAYFADGDIEFLVSGNVDLLISDAVRVHRVWPNTPSPSSYSWSNTVQNDQLSINLDALGGLVDTSSGFTVAISYDLFQVPPGGSRLDSRPLILEHGENYLGASFIMADSGVTCSPRAAPSGNYEQYPTIYGRQQLSTRQTFAITEMGGAGYRFGYSGGVSELITSEVSGELTDILLGEGNGQLGGIAWGGVQGIITGITVYPRPLTGGELEAVSTTKLG